MYGCTPWMWPTTWERSPKKWELLIPSFEELFWGGSTLVMVPSGLPHALRYACALYTPPFHLPMMTTGSAGKQHFKLPTGGFPLFLRKGPDCVADPFRNVPCRCFLTGRERAKRQIGNIPKRIGKIPEKSQKDKKGQIGTDESQSPGTPPRLNPPPPLLALERLTCGRERHIAGDAFKCDLPELCHQLLTT